MAIGRAEGPEVDVELLAHPDLAGPLSDYQPYHAAREDLLLRAGRRAEAIRAYRDALDHSKVAAERRFFERHLAQHLLRGHLEACAFQGCGEPFPFRFEPLHLTGNRSDLPIGFQRDLDSSVELPLNLRKRTAQRFGVGRIASCLDLLDCEID